MPIRTDLEVAPGVYRVQFDPTPEETQEATELADWKAAILNAKENWATMSDAERMQALRKLFRVVYRFLLENQ